MLRTLVMATSLALISLSALADVKFNKAGFETHVQDGRLWVFKADSAELAAFKAQGEPAIFVSRIGDGPEGMTLRGNNNDVLEAYINSK
ncbi:MAG: hypothetical protein V4688_07325 [Pseudomonadota bacterium]